MTSTVGTKEVSGSSSREAIDGTDANIPPLCRPGRSAVAVGVPEMITGEQIQDGTITSRDVKDRSLHAYDLRPAARRLLSTHSSGAAVENYQDLDAIARQTLPFKGFYVAFTQFRARNSGASDASLDCGYRMAPTRSEQPACSPKRAKPATASQSPWWRLPSLACACASPVKAAVQPRGTCPDSASPASASATNRHASRPARWRREATLAGTSGHPAGGPDSA
jgi:hypothetical protein